MENSSHRNLPCGPIPEGRGLHMHHLLDDFLHRYQPQSTQAYQNRSFRATFVRVQYANKRDFNFREWPLHFYTIRCEQNCLPLLIII